MPAIAGCSGTVVSTRRINCHRRQHDTITVSEQVTVERHGAAGNSAVRCGGCRHHRVLNSQLRIGVHGHGSADGRDRDPIKVEVPGIRPLGDIGVRVERDIGGSSGHDRRTRRRHDVSQRIRDVER